MMKGNITLLKANIKLLIVLACLVCSAMGQSVQKPSDQASLTETLSFEGQHAGDAPQGWSGGPPRTVFVDGKIVHGGQWAARIERNADSPSSFSALSKSIPVDFTGTTVELRGFLRLQDVSGFAGLWMRQDGDSPALEFDNMQKRQLNGTKEWAEYSITLPVHPEARQLVVGVLLAGTGKVWADDLQLLVDGKPVWDAPKSERPKTALDLDHEFDVGSGIVLNELTKVQIDNLTTLGKVWGFLKYHHPVVTSGQRHWDYELFRVLSAIISAPDRGAANAALLRWVAALGTVSQCKPCAKLDESNLHFRPDVGWTTNEKLVGAGLSQSLRSIYENRSANGKQFYVSFPGVGNPSFDHELGYERLKFPDPGFRILALYRFWNIIEYWFPYRDVAGEDWDKVLAEFIPRIALAKDSDSYQRELIALIARAHDSHANLWSSLQVRPPAGNCQLPVNLRFVENRPVVTGYLESELVKPSGLAIGDIVIALDGITVANMVENWSPYYAASNEASRLRDIARSMTRGDCRESTILLSRNGQELKLQVKRIPLAGLTGGMTHDLPGETFRLLSTEVAYLKLSSVKAADATHYLDAAAGTKGLIIDIRNYPSEFMVVSLGSLLVARETPFARFTTGDPSNPGAFHWGKEESLVPQQPHYAGRVVVLVDETSQSQAEFTTMAFRSAPNVVVAGSTTAGADGNISPFALPGGLRTMISGIGVFYPDKRPTQRIGIVPDVEVKPTIAGIRAGRDEVLEEAIRLILGRKASDAEIRKMIRP